MHHLPRCRRSSCICEVKMWPASVDSTNHVTGMFSWKLQTGARPNDRNDDPARGESQQRRVMPQLDLETLQLKNGVHSAASKEMCIMEAVAYVAGEPWSDHPACACPVIAAFLRSYNDSVSDEVRQTLKPFIPRLVGTKSSAAVEERRALAATDWLIRVHAPAWLRLAGLSTQADALASLPEITATAQIPSIRPSIEAARQDAAAAAAA